MVTIVVMKIKIINLNEFLIVFYDYYSHISGFKKKVVKMSFYGRYKMSFLARASTCCSKDRPSVKTAL